MPKTRINKFIFQDGQVFLRVKTTAQQLKINKVNTDYSIEFTTAVTGENPIQAPVVFINECLVPDTIHNEASQLGYKTEESVNVKPIFSSENYSWGQLICLKTPNKKSLYYYAKPDNYDFAVKIGPLPCQISPLHLEIDWANLQWGIQ